MEEGISKSGVDRSIESRFKFLIKDFFMFPFYLCRSMFLKTDLGTGYILKAQKING
jgi:hypothetical protein